MWYLQLGDQKGSGKIIRHMWHFCTCVSDDYSVNKHNYFHFLTRTICIVQYWKQLVALFVCFYTNRNSRFVRIKNPYVKSKLMTEPTPLIKDVIDQNIFSKVLEIVNCSIHLSHILRAIGQWTVSSTKGNWLHLQWNN